VSRNGLFMQTRTFVPSESFSFLIYYAKLGVFGHGFGIFIAALGRGGMIGQKMPEWFRKRKAG